MTADLLLFVGGERDDILGGVIGVFNVMETTAAAAGEESGGGEEDCNELECGSSSCC